MTASDLFARLDGLILPAIHQLFPDYYGCILASRIAVEVAAYFGIAARPLPCQVVLYNAAFRRHIEAGDPTAEAKRWLDLDGSYLVGIGLGAPARGNAWDCHLVVEAGGWFADYTIQQAERPMCGIVTGSAMVGPIAPGAPQWKAEHDLTTVEYKRSTDERYRHSPDWCDPVRRKKIAGPLIRQLVEQV